MSNVYVLVVKSSSYKDNENFIKYTSQVPRKGECMFDCEGYVQTITNVIWYPPKKILSKYPSVTYVGYNIKDIQIEAIIYVS